MDYINVVYRHAQFIGHNLGESGFLTLTMGGCAHKHVHLTSGVETDYGTFPQSAAKTNSTGYLGRAKAANFAVATHADAHVRTVFSEMGLFLPQSLIVNVLQDQVHVGFVVTAVVGKPGSHVVAIVELGYQVAAPYLHRVDAQLFRQQIHQPLQQEGRFRPAGSPVCLHRSGVGKHSVHVALDVRDVVGSRVHQAVQDGGDSGGCRGKVGAHAGIDHRAQPGDFAVPGGCHLHVLYVVPTVGGCLKVFASGLSPLDRASQLHRTENGDHFPGIHCYLAAETTAHFRGNHPYLVLRQAGDQRAEEPHDVRVLGCVP